MTVRKRKLKKSYNDYSIFGNVREFEPYTEVQSRAYQSYKDGKNLLISGFAGTGKTHIAVSIAINALVNKEVEKIKIIRSAVQARDIGFLPGSLNEKLAVYEAPYQDTFNKILKRGDGYCLMKQKDLINFECTSFQRGHTYNDTLVIFDEAQNAIFSELFAVISRLGDNSRIIILGDNISNFQCDLRKEKNGFFQIQSIAEKMKPWFDVYEMDIDDIVRSEFVKNFVIQAYKYV